MSERITLLLLERLQAIASRRSRFCFDVRGHSYVTSDIVAAYNVPMVKAGPPSLREILEHALAHDAIVSGERDRNGQMRFTSCRLFTDRHNATSFARAQGQSSVYNWNRGEEIPVEKATC